MDLRQQRGLVIAATLKIRRQGAAYLVPSQSVERRFYKVDALLRRCTCPDFEERQQPCKHVYALEIYMRVDAEQVGEGETQIIETKGIRLTYAQPWAAYNRAQTTEKEAFCTLLRDLCAGIPEPEQTRGRPRLPLSDMVFAAGFKVYSTASARRFMTDLRDAEARGLITKAPHYNSIFNCIESEGLTPILHDLITTSSLPLREVECDFAVDSTGFGTSSTFHYYSMKYKREQVVSDWLKVHAMVGVKTNVVTAVRITGRNDGDSPQFPALVRDTARHFAMREVSADKAYSSKDNLALVAECGAEPYVIFKDNARLRPDAPTWNRLYHFFAMNRPEFLNHYHKRSNVESTFSMIKRVFGDSLRSRLPVARINEVLLKVLCHNVRCLIHAMHELGVPPAFEPTACPQSPRAAQQLTLG